MAGQRRGETEGTGPRAPSVTGRAPGPGTGVPPTGAARLPGGIGATARRACLALRVVERDRPRAAGAVHKAAGARRVPPALPRHMRYVHAPAPEVRHDET